MAYNGLCDRAPGNLSLLSPNHFPFSPLATPLLLFLLQPHRPSCSSLNLPSTLLLEPFPLLIILSLQVPITFTTDLLQVLAQVSPFSAAFPDHSSNCSPTSLARNALCLNLLYFLHSSYYHLVHVVYVCNYMLSVSPH